ncbi:hypothetical protein PHMEG_0001123 [Phytophthora megakarya]|uniref:Uncharacterized protein n=1 Tax=Phytophthora megakarya TaxID=4795 RepID=A0A225X3W0_9STRA|nr:hypothetical protein PHMEG_0001123 [Phytophthora megakarya]
MELRRQISERGAKIVDLNVQLGESLGSPLKRLDLSNVQLGSGHVELILKSAAKYCHNVQSVVLPGEKLQERIGFDSIFGALYAALEAWHASGSGAHRGLRQLTVPIINERDQFKSRKQLFDNVVKFCPNLEYLDGYKKTLCEMDKLTCQDDWLITIEQWEEFNTKCTELREFNWVVAPFADPFFRVFGEHVKPRLKKLTFGVNMLWDWGEYFNSLSEAAGVAPPSPFVMRNVDRPGYGFKATDVSSALKSCPALDDLEIQLYHPVDGDELGYTDPYEDDTADFPEHEVLNIDIYGEKFCEALAEYCPLLTSFSIWEIAEGHNNYLTPIRTFTDRGLIALAQLKYLTTMELRTINCTGSGIFDFLDTLSDEFVGQRTFQICVGGHPSDFRLAFYNVLRELLQKLEEKTQKELAWGRRKFVLRMMNSNFDSVEPSWSEQYLRDLEPVVKNVKNLHSDLRLRITTSGRCGSTFRSIIELGLYTANAEPSPWYGWDDEESNRNITFVNRGGDSSVLDEAHRRLPVELRHPELLDPDSLPIDYELPADYFDDYGGYGDYSDDDDYFGEDGDEFYDGNADELWE